MHLPLGTAELTRVRIGHDGVLTEVDTGDQPAKPARRLKTALAAYRKGAATPSPAAPAAA